MKNEKGSDNIIRILSVCCLLLAAAVILYFSFFYKSDEKTGKDVTAQVSEMPTVAKEETAEPEAVQTSGTEEIPDEPVVLGIMPGGNVGSEDPAGGENPAEGGENPDAEVSVSVNPEPIEEPIEEPEPELTPEEEEALLLEEVYEIADGILADILTEDMTQREQAWAIFRYVRHNITYKARREGDTYASSAYASFNKRVGDCFNFYVASEVLLTRAGIDNMMVQRNGGETHHYWNLVNVGEGWYHFDASPRRVGDPYICFLQTDAQVAKYNTTYRPDYYNFDPEGLPERSTVTTYWSSYYTPPVEEPEVPAEPEVPETDPQILETNPEAIPEA